MSQFRREVRALRTSRGWREQFGVTPPPEVRGRVLCDDDEPAPPPKIRERVNVEEYVPRPRPSKTRRKVEVTRGERAGCLWDDRGYFTRGPTGTQSLRATPVRISRGYSSGVLHCRASIVFTHNVRGKRFENDVTVQVANLRARVPPREHHEWVDTYCRAAAFDMYLRIASLVRTATGESTHPEFDAELRATPMMPVGGVPLIEGFTDIHADLRLNSVNAATQNICTMSGVGCTQ